MSATTTIAPPRLRGRFRKRRRLWLAPRSVTRRLFTQRTTYLCRAWRDLRELHTNDLGFYCAKSHVLRMLCRLAVPTYISMYRTVESWALRMTPARPPE